MKNQFLDFYCWVIADCMYNLWWHIWFSSVLSTKIVQNWPNSQEICAISWNKWKINFQISSFWGIVDLVLKFRHFSMLGEIYPPKPLKRHYQNIFFGSKVANFQERCTLLWKLFFSSLGFFVRLLVFEI